MTLNRWDPFRDLLNFQEKVNRIIDMKFHEKRGTRGACWCPAVDMLETPDSYIFRAELPGVGIDNIDIEVRHRRLTLSGVRPVESEPVTARTTPLRGYTEHLKGLSSFLGKWTWTR